MHVSFSQDSLIVLIKIEKGDAFIHHDEFSQRSSSANPDKLARVCHQPRKPVL
jgi:hypothetical protein